MLTRKPSARKRKRGAVIAAIAVGSVIATWLLGDVKFFQLVHLKAGDLHFLVRGKKPTSNIVILAIDQKTQDSFRELRYFWHPYYAEAIRAAAEGGAKVFMMDIVFGVDVTKYEKNHDQMLAQAVVESAAKMPVICANIASMNSRAQDWPVAVNMMAAALNLNAFPNLTADSDDFIRSQELIEQPDATGNFTRGFAFRVAEKFRGVEGKIENGQLTWAGRTIPRTIAINYAGPPGTFPSISLSDFIEAARGGNREQIRKWVDGKAVLLGPDNPVEDRHPTPYYTAFSGSSWNTAGVEIHANTLRTLLDGDFLTPEAWGYQLLALLLVGALTAVAAASLAAAQTAYVVLGEIALIALFTHLMFRANVLVSTSELLLTCLISAMASMVYRIVTAETFGKVFQNAISIFVGKRFAATLSEEQNISLSGTRQLVTILFSDIRGFTAFCEEKDPALVVDLLNEYMGAMVKIIVRYNGNVNKFIGDGILAIFSDEDGTTSGDHPLRAVRCGVEMVQFVGKFKTGVGIHSGLAVVGNVGSQDKMEYTVLGDTVNLASRLESLNKEMKTQLILSEATKELLEGGVATTYLGEVPVRGKTAPLVIYTATVLCAPKTESGAMAEKS